MPITVLSKRRGTSVYFGVTLADSQITVNWTDLDIKDVFMYSEAQRSYAGRCTYVIDDADPSKLHVTYPAEKQQFLGLHRLVVRVVLEGTEATYDAPAINLVASMEQAATPVVSEEVAIGIEITEVDTTILHEILRACQEATDAANAAVTEAEQAIEDAEAATTAANAAAELANAKAAAAQSAATTATNAAALANEKAALANAAAAAAQQAKTAADEAVAAAMEAKAAADASAENADAKAALAQQAANSANTAATLAEARATEAHDAAAAAQQAKNAANTAAAAAQTAATEATSAAAEASAKAILASDAAQAATQAATLANTKAGEAGNAAAAANTAASAATTAADAATTAAESANAAAAAAQAAADTVEAFIANFEHAYLESQRVGLADNITPQGEGSEVEFTSRVLTDVEENSVAMFPKILGRSLVWNQMAKDYLEPTNIVALGGSSISYNGRDIRITYADTSSASAVGLRCSAFIVGHKILLHFNNENNIPLTATKLGSRTSASGPGTTSGFQGGYTVLNVLSYGNGTLWFWPSDPDKIEGNFSDFWFTDLTKMFGTGNEPATYEEFLQRKPLVEDEYAYDEGEIINNKVAAIKTTNAEGGEEKTLNLSWIKDIKDAEGNVFFPEGLRSNSTAYDEITATKAIKRIGVKVFDGTEAVYHESDYFVVTLSNTGMKKYAPTSCICNQYITIGAGISDKYVSCRSNGNGFIIKDSDYGTNENAWKVHLADLYAQGNPIVVCYELETPVEVEYPAQNLCVKQTTGGVMTVEAEPGQNTTPVRAMLVNGLNAFGRLMAIGNTSELRTTAKKVVDAINELYAMITGAAAQSAE